MELTIVLPDLSSLPPSEVLATLIKLKNSLIGQNQRKLAFLKSGQVDKLIGVIKEPKEEATQVELDTTVQAVTILGALSLPTPIATYILLQTHVHTTITNLLTALTASPLFKFNSSRHAKLLESLLRSLKLLYVDLVKITGPRAWGTDVIGASVGLGERKDVGVSLDFELGSRGGAGEKEAAGGVGGGKGKGKDVGIMPEAKGGPPKAEEFFRLASQALDAVYHVTETTIASSSATSTSCPTTSRPSTSASHSGTLIRKRTPTPLLAYLLTLLSSCGSSVSPSSSKAQQARDVPKDLALRVADLVCQFLAGTVRTQMERMAVVGEAEAAVAVTIALFRVLEGGSGKVQEAALNTLSALSRDFRRLAMLLTTGLQQLEGRAVVDLIAEVMQSPVASLRLAAVTCRVIIFKTLRASPAVASPSTGEPLVPVLLGLIETEPGLRANATFTLAYLMADNESLQEIAVNHHHKALEVVRDVLSQPPRVQQPYQTPASLEEIARVKEGCLMILAVLVSTSETHRKSLIDLHLLPIIVSSLSHPSAGVKASACHCIRGLARSLHVLRTGLMETGAARPIYELLGEKEDLVVQVTAAAAVSNLVLEFSPIRQSLLDYGCIPRLCQLVRSADVTLKINALWALKNSMYEAQGQFKRSVAAELGWQHLGDMISDPNDEIAEQALGLLRNFTVSHADDSLGFREMGEERMLVLLEGSLASKSDGIVLQALFVVVNLATSDEHTKLALIARVTLLKLVTAHFNHSDPEIRAAAIWPIINLCHRDHVPTTSTRNSFSSAARKPVEIVTRLRSLGIPALLMGMMEDTSLNVRERVRDALVLLQEAH